MSFYKTVLNHLLYLHQGLFSYNFFTLGMFFCNNCFLFFNFLVCIVWYNSSHGGGKNMLETFQKEIELYESNAELLKVLAHPVRLCIVKGLIERGPSNVSTMYTGLNMPQSTISQHLAKLKSAKIVSSERKGLEIYYKVETRQLFNSFAYYWVRDS